MEMRQSQAHAQSRGHRVLNLHFAVIDFEHVGDNSQPKSGAGCVRVEPAATFDHIRQFLFGNAGPVILENDLQFILRFQRADGHPRARPFPGIVCKSQDAI